MVTQIPIILASNSPRRKELLERAGYTFTVMPSDCDEATDIRFPKDMVMELAGRKAENVYKKVCQTMRYGGGDTAVYRDRFRYGRRIKWQDPWKTG